jgi:hypothetical protein
MLYLLHLKLLDVLLPQPFAKDILVIPLAMD